MSDNKKEEFKARIADLTSKIEKCLEDGAEAEGNYRDGLEEAKDYDIQEAPFGEEEARLNEALTDLGILLEKVDKVTGPFPAQLEQEAEEVIENTEGTLEPAYQPIRPLCVDGRSGEPGGACGRAA